MKKCYDKNGNVIPCNDITGNNPIQQAINYAKHLAKKYTPKTDTTTTGTTKKETKTKKPEYKYGGKINNKGTSGGRHQHN